MVSRVYGTGRTTEGAEYIEHNSKASSRIEQRDTVHTRQSNLSKRFRFRNSLASLSVLVIRTSPTAPRVRLRPGRQLLEGQGEIGWTAFHEASSSKPVQDYWFWF